MRSSSFHLHIEDFLIKMRKERKKKMGKEVKKSKESDRGGRLK
jgi:hypothetical protein